jgi:hypothetical protein
MMMNKITYTQEEKLRIIKEDSEQGVKVILEKGSVPISVSVIISFHL